jgi:glycosyltransferase involved in cell wall biosynthesis
MSSSDPWVTVVTSTYNRAETVRAGIASVVAQEFQEWEMCVVGDCTPDETERTVASFEDSRLRFYNLREKSPPRSHGALAKNHALKEMARGTYIAYLDDDDVYRPDHLITLVEYMQAHPECVFAYTRCAYKDKRTGRRILGNPFQRWMHGYSRQKLQTYNFIDTDSVMHTRALLDEVGYWDPAYYFDDYELWLRISEKHDLAHVNRVTVDKFVEESPILVRAFTKGWRILRHGRGMPVE